MNVIDTHIPDVKIIEPQAFGDDRGFYVTSDEAEFVYKCTDYYNPHAEVSLQ
ncbi:dTDP-4-dehydrorhamnose 3,5-epimerase [Vibrio variabilis]|uniref:dTDP-4-dehydrorhamnose 3,5-epimerase n=1 Tax=Vibrio variabilis TaxID=990271 RepID=A0ABQ0J6D6_9VIBR|nr:dTDP-4-dehydrorhamnose 3,5-epimerase [Vibrio variabilis]